MKIPVFSVLFLLWVCGCATTAPRYQLSIGNEHGQRSLRDVQVVADGRVLQEFSRIGPVKSAALRPRRGVPPLELTVRWTDPEGRRQEQSFAPRQDMPVDFEGMLFVKIAADQQTELVRIASTRDDASILPWNVPESWEGSIGIPGMGER